MILEICDRSELKRWRKEIHANSAASVSALKALGGDPLEFLSKVKFEAIGRHPMENRPLNFIEQLSQTFTYLVALNATDLLFDWHPEANGFRLAPGAHAPKGTLDIESRNPGLVGAETFAAPPKNNRKLARDLEKLSERSERFRYVFFNAPEFCETGRHKALERSGVQVWSVGLA